MPINSPVFQPRRLGHINLWVNSQAKSVAFYSGLCGLNLEFREPDLLAAFLGTGNTPHDLGVIEVTKGRDRVGKDGHIQIPKTAGIAPGLGHFAFEMENEVAVVEGCNRARDRGISYQRALDHSIAHSAYFADPDGNSVEFYCDTVPEWRKVLQGDVELVTSVWDPWEKVPSSESLLDRNPEHRVVREAPIHPRSLSHVVLTTSNMEVMREFYVGFAGLRPVYEAPDGSVVCLAGPASNADFDVALCQQSASKGYHHVTFKLETPEDVEVAIRQVVAAGGSVEREIDNEVKRAFFLSDPDGMGIEFAARRSKSPACIEAVTKPDRPFMI